MEGETEKQRNRITIYIERQSVKHGIIGCMDDIHILKENDEDINIFLSQGPKIELSMD